MWSGVQDGAERLAEFMRSEPAVESVEVFEERGQYWVRVTHDESEDLYTVVAIRDGFELRAWSTM